ncbi:MAG: hypothetical protein HFF37_04400 [Coprobacillus sp.]|nr:hypothetical protein [Coprobacillus sp.]
MNNKKWTIFAITYQCIFAYIIALIIYQIGNLIFKGIFGIGTIVAIVLLMSMIYLLIRPIKENNKWEVEFSVK